MYHLIKDNEIIDSRSVLKGSFKLEDGRALSNLEALDDEELKALGWLKETESRPDYNSKEGKLTGPTTDITSEAVIKTYAFEPFTEEEKEALKQAKVAQIWQQAHELEIKYISGSAVGLLTMGVMQAKPKCYAVQLWIKSIWEKYYEAKAQLTYKSDIVGSLTRPDLITGELTAIDNPDAVIFNLEDCGAIPYSVPELMAELGI